MSFDPEERSDKSAGAEAGPSRSQRPRSIRPHLFENEASISRPFQEGRIKPSDLLTEADYRRLRSATAKRGILAGATSAVVTTFAVRRFWPRRLTSPQLAMTFMVSGMTGIWLSSTVYLRSEMNVVYKKAEEMSRAQLKARSTGEFGGLPDGERAMGDPFDRGGPNIRI